MEPYQQRVIDEKLELDAKLKKLSAFMESEQFAKVPATQHRLLTIQFSVMKAYSDILQMRIVDFT